MIPARVGTAVLHPAAPTLRRGPRSYAHDGRCLELVPAAGWEVAGDVEALDAPAAPYLAARAGLAVPELLRLWTRLEVTAKLLGRPAAALFRDVLRGEPLPRPPGLVLRTAVGSDVVVSVGWRAKSR